MATYQFCKPAAKPVITLTFATYNEAIDFVNKSQLLNPSKPFKRVVLVGSEARPLWHVSLVNKSVKHGQWKRLDDAPMGEPIKPNRRIKRVYDEIASAVEFALDFGRWTETKQPAGVH